MGNLYPQTGHQFARLMGSGCQAQRFERFRALWEGVGREGARTGRSDNLKPGWRGSRKSAKSVSFGTLPA